MIIFKMLRTLKLLISFIGLMMLNLACNKSVQSSDKIFGQENAVWTESIYLRGIKPSTGQKLNDYDLKKYSKTLKENNIKYAYLFAGPYQKNGELPDYPFSNLARESVKKLKKYYPEIIILPWVGGVQNKTVYLQDSLWVENAIKDTKRLIETLNTPGVHIDFEYILKGHPYLDTTIEPEIPGDKENYAKYVNLFHKKLRNLLPDAFISSVVVATSPDTKPWKRKTKIEELQELVNNIDQLSFLYYDTGINSQSVFEKNCIAQIRDIQNLKKSNSQVQFLLSIGTFINRKELRSYRNLKIENISNTLKVIKRSALKLDSNNRIVDGISIFCDWQTDEYEWREFYNQWVAN